MPLPLRSLGHRAPLLWLTAPLAAGVVLGRCGWSMPVLPLLGMALGVILLAGFSAYRWPRVWPWALTAGLICAGLANYALHRPALPDWADLPPREAVLDVRVTRVFANTDPRRASGLAIVDAAPVHLQDLVGQRCYFSLQLAAGQKTPLRSAVLRVRGLWQRAATASPAGSFAAYLDDAGVNFQLTRARLLTTVQPANRYQQICAATADWLYDLLGRGIAEHRPELTGVLRAMLLGRQQELSEEQTDLFRRSGTMHLFAISGLHIGVIAAALYGLGLFMRLPRVVLLPLNLIVLWFYVDVTGTAPSAVRAFLMVAWVETALVCRRPINPVATLIGAALVVLAFAPLQLFSASFQMSYGIVAALILIGLPLAETWQRRWQPFALLPKATWHWWHHLVDRGWRWGSTAVALGVATTPVSWICGIHFFQLFTPGALLANLALIPASTFAILGGFASIVLGGLSGGLLAPLFNHAAAVVLWGIDIGVRFFAGLPGAALIARFRAPWIGEWALLLFLAACLVGYGTHWERRGGGWWPPAILLVATLLFGVAWG